MVFAARAGNERAMTKADWENTTLGILGAGNMAEALIRGVLAAELIPPANILAHDPSVERRDVFARLGCPVSDTPNEATSSDVVLLAVKPQTVRPVLKETAGYFRPGALVISIAAGVPLALLAELLPKGVKAVRVMPNTPLLVGHGMSCLAPGRGVKPEETALAVALFSAAGRAVEIEEDLMDAVTALSGSGPAYVFRFAEVLVEAGARLGLDPGLAARLTTQTLRGAAEMLAGGDDPAELRRRVTSPGGTTAAALDVFEQRDFAGMVAEALAAAKHRGEELGRDA